jgi:hypothetical protein
VGVPDCASTGEIETSNPPTKRINAQQSIFRPPGIPHLVRNALIFNSPEPATPKPNNLVKRERLPLAPGRDHQAAARMKKRRLASPPSQEIAARGL